MAGDLVAETSPYIIGKSPIWDPPLPWRPPQRLLGGSLEGPGRLPGRSLGGPGEASPRTPPSQKVGGSVKTPPSLPPAPLIGGPRSLTGR
jgi:hypothetical protein